MPEQKKKAQAASKPKPDKKSANPNMKLWDAVCQSDPKYLTEVSSRGGYTAITAQYQIREATKLWGSYGGAWGVKDCKYHNIEQSKEIKGEAVWSIVETTIDAVFYYPDGEFQISTDMEYRSGNDTRKKLLTNLTTKALSKLGFNADVFMNELKHDGQKYLFSGGASADDKAEIARLAEDVKVELNNAVTRYDETAHNKSIKTVGFTFDEAVDICRTLRWNHQAIKLAISVIMADQEEKNG